MPTSNDDRQAADPAAAFRGRLAGLRAEGAYDRWSGSHVPWDRAPEPLKLAAIIRTAVSASVTTGPVSGAETLAAVDREVDPAGLPAWQREMLGDVRARLAAGELDGPHRGRVMDLAWSALDRIAARDDFDGWLEKYKADGLYARPRNTPWADVPEPDKVSAIVGLAWQEGPAGAHALATIEREVDYGRLPPWRRAALEGLRARLDRGELAGDQLDDLRDRANYALRLAEFESRVEDCKQLGDRDARGHRPWQAFSEAQKLDRIWKEAGRLHLDFEPRRFEVIDREVDLSRLPEGRRWAVEANREVALLGPEEYERRRQAPYQPPNEAAAEFKRRIEEGLRETHFPADGTFYDVWFDLGAEEKLHHLARVMDWDRVPEAYFRTMVGRELDVAELPEAKRAALESPKASRRIFSEGLDKAKDRPAAASPPGEQDRIGETDLEKDRRHQYLMFNGEPMPAGWRLPSLIGPPDRSDPAAVQRASREISSLKSARFESWRPVPFDAGAAIAPGETGFWDELTEYGKLDVMQHWVNWDGVSMPDRVGLVAAQLDLEGLPPDIREELREHGGPTDGLAGRVFDATGASPRRSPSDIAREGRSGGREPAGQETRAPSDIARGRGTAEPGPERSVKDENDRDR